MTLRSWLAVCALAMVGCSSDPAGGSDPAKAVLPSDGPVGTPCTAEPLGSASVVAQSGAPNLGKIAQARFSLDTTPPSGFIALAETVQAAQGCGCCQINSAAVVSFLLDEETLTLGELPIGPGADEVEARVRVESYAEATPASGGTLTLEGFDPETKSLCGSATIEVEGELNTTVTVTFVAHDTC